MDQDKSVVEKLADAVKGMLEPEVGGKPKDKVNTTANADYATAPAKAGARRPKATKVKAAAARKKSAPRKAAKRSAPKMARKNQRLRLSKNQRRSDRDLKAQTALRHFDSC
jgi:hypothetical protein